MGDLRKRDKFWGLTREDILVVLALWILNYVRPWFAGWHGFTYNLNLQRVASFESVVLICQILMTGGLSLICDVRHQKYKVYMYFLFLYGIFPFYGLVETVLPSFTLRFMMDWLQSTSGIIFPIQFGAVFQQKPYISRANSYIWLTIFTSLGALNGFVVPRVIPFDCPLPDAKIIPIWIVLLLTYWQILLMVCYVFKYVKEEVFREKHLKTAIQGLKVDRKVGNDVVWWIFGRKTLRFFIFLLLILPVVYSSLLFESLQILEIRKDLNFPRWASTTNMLPLGKLIGTPTIAAALITARKTWPKTANVLTLGAPHLLNLLALTIIFSRISGYQAGDVYFGPIPDNSSMVLLFINADYNNRSACVHSDYFEPMRIRAMESLTRVVRTDKSEIDFLVVLDPSYDTFLPRRQVVGVQKDAYIIFMILLGSVPLNNVFIFDAVELVRVRGAEAVRPNREVPQFVWMTSIGEFVNKTELQVSNGNGTQVRTLPRMNDAIVESVPSVETNISVVYVSPIKKEIEIILAGCTVHPEPNAVYGVVIHEHNRLARLAVKLQRVRPSLLNMWPSKSTVHVITLMKLGTESNHKELPCRNVLREDPAIAAAYFIHGAADSLVTIGYLHLFWKDSPLRLRTFLLALVTVLTWLLALLPDLKDIDFYRDGFGVMPFTHLTLLLLLVFQFVFTVMHFLLAFLFYNAFLISGKSAIEATSDSAYETPSNEPVRSHLNN